MPLTIAARRIQCIDLQGSNDELSKAASWHINELVAIAAACTRVQSEVQLTPGEVVGGGIRH